MQTRGLPRGRRRADDRSTGSTAFVGTYVGALQSLGRVAGARAHIVHDRERLSRRRHRADRTLPERVGADVLEEPRVVPADDARRSGEPPAQPHRALHGARRATPGRAIAERQGKGVVKATTLAIMNGHAVNDQPRPGERLKIVVGG